VLVEADDHVNRNDVDFPDVLIAIVSELAKQLHDELGITLEPGYFRSRWEQLKSIFTSEVKLDQLTLQAGMAKLSATIKHSPSARHEIRGILETHSDSWLKAANDILAACPESRCEV
jgi:hypothetical protein